MRILSTFLLSVILFLAGCTARPEADVPDTTALLDELSASLTEASAEPVVQNTDIVAAEGSVSQYGDNIPISRALAARIIAIALYGNEQAKSIERMITFTDSSPTDWYDIYVNILFAQNIMTGYGDTFKPDEMLTLTQMQSILDKVNPANKIKLTITEQNKNAPISYALFADLFMKSLESIDAETRYGLENEQLIVLASHVNNKQIPSGYAVTDEGLYRCAGIDMDVYTDKQVGVVVKDRDILWITEEYTHDPTLTNVYIVRNDANTITIFAGGAERTYAYADGINKPSGRQGGNICDITIHERSVTALNLYEKKITGKILLVDDGRIELAGHGNIETEEGFRTYEAMGKPRMRAKSDLVTGSDIAVFYMKDEKACAAVIVKDAKFDKIRVALNTTGFGGLVHETVTLTATGDYSVSAGDGRFVKQFKRDEVFEAKDMIMYGRLSVAPVKPEDKITITSIKRNYPDGQHPSYAGTIEISLEKDGYAIVNELPLEQYLYGVLPSEMPASYGLEALKVQAVTARSYAYKQLFENRFAGYGANVDDSVMCQVYNNLPLNDLSVQAVDQTRGAYLTYDGEIIAANFFSTSSGYTALSGEVWPSEGNTYSRLVEFPATSKPYLKSAKQYEGADVGDMSNEEIAAAFFKRTDIDAYDAASPYFRWTANMTAQELTTQINTAISDIYNRNPALLLTQQRDGTFASKPVKSIGQLKKMEAVSRGQGGNIMELKITGSEATVLVRTEYNIRFLLKPTAVKRKDGSESTDNTCLPSAFFVFEEKLDDKGNLEAVTFYGGGNGHGVGMSQYGVKGMTERGFTYADILQHYYNGSQVVEIK